MQGASSTVSYQANVLFGGDVDRYFRIDGPLDIASDDMDDASKDNLVALRLEAEKIVKANTQTIDKVVSLL